MDFLMQISLQLWSYPAPIKHLIQVSKVKSKSYLSESNSVTQYAFKLNSAAPATEENWHLKGLS
jgi:hypothetical protein